MAAHTDRSARTPGNEVAGLLLVQSTSAEERADGDATTECVRPLKANWSVWAHFLENLRRALGGWNV